MEEEKVRCETDGLFYHIDDNNIVQCETDGLYYLKNDKNIVKCIDGWYYLLNESMISCHKCNRYGFEDDMKRLAEGDVVCIDCIDMHYSQCDFCDKYSNHTIYMKNLGKIACKSCYDKLFDHCDRCDGYYSASERCGCEDYDNYLSSLSSEDL